MIRSPPGRGRCINAQYVREKTVRAGAGWGVMTGDELKAHRLRAKLSRRALAEQAGVHKDTVQYWEGKALIDPRGWAPQRIAKALGLMIFPASNARARGGVLGTSRLIPAVPWYSWHPRPPCPKRVICGAKTRKGMPCRAKSEPGRRRCKFHGGMSTGPKTPEGKARIAEAQRRRWQRSTLFIGRK
jgi:DNA-binding XRE family transcriptional regulator